MEVQATEVQNAINNMAEACCCDGSGKLCVPCRTADLLTRLSSALASAERDRVDWARTWKLGKGESDETFTTPARWMARALDAEAKLREARALALEEAAKVVDPPGDRPCDCDTCYCGNHGDMEAVAAWEADNCAAKAIRALKDKKE